MFVGMMYIAFVWVFIIDMSKGPTAVINWLLRRVLHRKCKDRKKWKPWECSFCMTWWACIVYAVLSPLVPVIYIPIPFTTLLLPFIPLSAIACAAFWALMTEPICHVIHCVRDIIGVSCNRITERLENGRAKPQPHFKGKEEAV